MSHRLESINEAELKRQKANSQAVECYASELRKSVRVCSDKFSKELGKSNEYLLIKFDDLLCLDDVKMHGNFFLIFGCPISILHSEGNLRIQKFLAVVFPQNLENFIETNSNHHKNIKKKAFKKF